MDEPRENTGEEPITPPPSYSAVVNNRSHQYGFVTPYPPSSPPNPVTPYPSATPPYPVTLDHTEAIDQMSMPMPMPMPASKPAPMPMPVPGSRVTYESYLNDDIPRENTSASYGIAEPFRTPDFSNNCSSTDGNRAAAVRVSVVNRGSSQRDQAVHVFPQTRNTSNRNSLICCVVIAFFVVLFGTMAAVVMLIRWY